MYMYHIRRTSFMYLYTYFRRNKVYASWQLDKASISVNRGSHFQVHFVWQVWDGQLSPSFKSIRLKVFGGWKFDRGTTKLHARILRGKGVQKKKPNMFTVGSSTSATFVLPVRHGTGVALQKRVWTFPKILNRTIANETPWQQWRRQGCCTERLWNQRMQRFYVEYDDQAEARATSSSRLDNSHWISFFYPASRQV